MTGRNYQPDASGRCNTCGKYAFNTRAEAKRFMRRHFPASGMSVYPCGDFYHLGHLSARVKAGDVDRRALRRKRYDL